MPKAKTANVFACVQLPVVSVERRSVSADNPGQDYCLAAVPAARDFGRLRNALGFRPWAAECLSNEGRMISKILDELPPLGLKNLVQPGSCRLRRSDSVLAKEVF